MGGYIISIVKSIVKSLLQIDWIWCIISIEQRFWGLTVIIIVDDGKQVRLNGRVAAMVRWLAEQAERLNQAPKMRVEFHCSGFSHVRPKIETIESEIPIQS